MRFLPLTPARLVEGLADWVRTVSDRQVAGPSGTGFDRNGTVIGVDGPAEIGTGQLADQVAEALRSSGVPVARAGTNWWWRPSALRLELGREDLDMLLTGWVDAEALTRELIDPIHGGRPYLTSLRDPDTDRSVRQPSTPWMPGTVVLLDGPFLLAAELGLDALVTLSVKAGVLERSLPSQRAWWLPAFDRYRREYEPVGLPHVVVSYDHPSAPAVTGLTVPETLRR